MAKAKTKKMTDEELLMPLPAIVQPAKGEVVYPEAKGVLAAQKDFLAARLKLVMSMEMTDENIERVRVLKKGIVGWRTGFDKQVKDYVKATYKGPMDVFNAAANEVLADIKEMEATCDEVLDREEEKRVANINTVLDGLIEDLEAEYGISFPDVERKKNYYNKTADMKAVAEDLREQFKAKAQEIKQKEADKKMIERACKSDERLNVSMYLDMLAYEPASVIVEKIENEKERLNSLNNTKEEAEEAAPEASEEVSSPAPLQIGVKVDPNKFKSDFPGLEKIMVLEIKYPVDVSDELTKVFAELQKAGVKMKVISKKEPEMPIF